MRKELKSIENIELYLNNQLNNEDKLAFELALLSDPSLQREVQLQKDLQGRIKLNAFKNALELHVQKEQYKGGGKGRKYLYWSLLLFLFMSLAGASFLWLRSEQATIETNAKIEDQKEFLEVLKDTLIELDTTNAPIEELKKSANSDRKIAKKSSSIPAYLQVPFERVFVDIDKGDTIEMKVSKSLIYVSPNSMQTSTGKKVKGKVEIRYREYRNLGDMVFSKIPMIYKEDSLEYYFSSAGMFEIRAYQDGKEIFMIPESPIVVDYYATEVLYDLSFFGLNDQTQAWTKLRDLNFSRSVIVGTDNIEELDLNPVKRVEKTPALLGGYEKYTAYLKNNELYQKVSELGLGGTYTLYLDINREGVLASIICFNNSAKYELMDSINYLIYKDLKGFEPGVISGDSVDMYMAVESKFAKTPQISSLKKRKNNEKSLKADMEEKEAALRAILATYLDSFDTPEDSVSSSPKFLIGQYLADNGIEKNRVNEKAYKTYTVGEKQGQQPGQGVKDPVLIPLLAGSDPGHQYPNLIRGLSLASFGVYNCDQIYRTQPLLNIQASYANERNELIDMKYLSMIDLRYNAAFSFNPAYFSFNPNASIFLFLLDEDNQVYTVDSESFKNMRIQASGKQQFKVVNQGKTLKSTQDLLTLINVSK